MHIESQADWNDERVRLFVLTPGDVGDAYVGWLNDPAVNRFLESRFLPHTIDSVRGFVEQMHASPSHLLLGIRSLKAGCLHVGNIKLGPIDRNHGFGEIGILVGDSACWGTGIATSAISVLCVIAHRQLGLRRLTAGCYASNVGSLKAFQKCGFSIEGRRPGHFLLDGVPEDLLLLGKCLGSGPQ